MKNARSKSSVDNGRIIISGTGRAGTTFLVQLLTRLGFDTGFPKDTENFFMDSLARAGLEGPLVGKNTKYVMKSPFFCDFLEEMIRDHNFKVHLALVPIRNLKDAAESRRKVYFRAIENGLDPFKQPGSLWRTRSPEQQEDKLAFQLYKLISAMTKYDVSYRLLDFPRLIVDSDYLYDKLYRLMSEHGVTGQEFFLAHRETARPGLISSF